MSIQICDAPSPSACPLRLPISRGGVVGPSGPIGVDGAGLWVLATALAEELEGAPLPGPGVGPHTSTAGESGERDGATGSSPKRSYEVYIRSDAWRRSTARLAELRASGGRCRLCARGAPETTVEVHHNTYRRMGRERPGDLCAVCRECHRVVTGLMRGRRYAAVDLPELRDTPRTLIRCDADTGGSG